MESPRGLFSRLPPPAEILAILLGAGRLSLYGISGIANPIRWAEFYGLPLQISTSTHDQKRKRTAYTEEIRRADETQKTEITLVGAIAARNITNGLLVVILGCWVRDRRALGWAVTVNAVTSLADMFIVRWFGNEKQVFGHAVGVVAWLSVGGSLLFWRRDGPWW